MTGSDALNILVALSYTDALLDGLRAAAPGAEIRIGDHLTAPGQDLPAELLRGTDVLIGEFMPRNFDVFDRLQWIQLSSAGYAQISDLPILERGIRVTNGLGNFDIGIAEWIVMMITMCHRHVPEMLANQHNHIWDRDARFQGELRGMTVGFFGYGGIARTTARLCRTMGMPVWALTRDGTARKRENIYCVEGTGDPDSVMCDRVFGPEGREQFFRGVDFLVLTMPITPATTGIVGERELRWLKSSAALVNPARAQLVDLGAFTRCMNEGWIRAAAIDVHYAYPLPPDHPMWTMPNTILTPHISGSTASPHFLERVFDIFSSNICRWLGGKPLLNELSTDQLRGK